MRDLVGVWSGLTRARWKQLRPNRKSTVLDPQELLQLFL
jgi:hypothetical protein